MGRTTVEGPSGRPKLWIQGSSLVREVRFRRTQRALARRERAMARGRPHQPLQAPRLWQRFLVTPVMALVNAARGLLVWTSGLLLPPPPRVLPIVPEEFLVVAHRGSAVTAVENTIDAYERAIDLEGANAIEIDLCVTRDHEVVVWHDWDPNELIAFARQAGAERYVRCRPVVPPEGHPMRRPVCELTLAQLRDHYGYAVISEGEPVPATIPLLEDVVRWAHHKPQLRAVLLDCKIPPEKKEMVRIVAATLERELARTPTVARFVFLTAHRPVLEELKKVVSGDDRSFDIEFPTGFFPDTSGISAVRTARTFRHAWATIGRPLFAVGGWGSYRRCILEDLATLRDTPPSPEGFPRVPAHYLCWTINGRREMRHLLRMGVTGMVTDFPLQLKELLVKALVKQAARAAR